MVWLVDLDSSFQLDTLNPFFGFVSSQNLPSLSKSDSGVVSKVGFVAGKIEQVEPIKSFRIRKRCHAGLVTGRGRLR
jgi:hypothetical protein